MQALNSFLAPIDVDLKNLFLDPNNPRFAELGGPFEPVPELRIIENRVQSDTFDQMKLEKFDVSELRDTIKTIGYLPVDRIILREWGGNKDTQHKKYVLVEGNRRVAALKWLIELHETGRDTLTSDQIQNFTFLPALLLDEINSPEFSKLVLPGLRHVSGIKEWGPYQKAKAVFALRSSGYPPKEVAQSLGLSTQAANLLWRSYLSLEQMKNNEEYGEFVEPIKYSYFEEIIKRPNLRIWLGWSDESKGFTNENHLIELYSWIIGEPNDSDNGEGRGEPKLPEAKSIRLLSKFIEDPTSMAIFRSPEGNLTRAISRIEAQEQQHWQSSILSTEATLASLTPDTLRSMSEEDVLIITKILERLNQILEDRTRLI